MIVAVLYKPGGAENFIIENRDIPKAYVGKVLVKIKAFGLNRSELMTRKGLSPNVKLPRVLGIECVGEVVDDPSGEYSTGQKVIAFMGGMGRVFDGSYAEYALLPKTIISTFESKLPWEILGALPEMFQTTYGSLYNALNIKDGETILIRGGTSSIGMLATQIAKIQGLQVISTTRNKLKKAILLDNGADKVIIDDGTISSLFNTLTQPKVDKVLELVGTSTLLDSLSCVKPGGIICMTGMLSEQWSIEKFAPMDYITSGTYLTIYDTGSSRIDSQYFQDFIRAIEIGKIVPQIKKTFTLKEISEAHRFMENNSGGGKIVVVV